MLSPRQWAALLIAMGMLVLACGSEVTGHPVFALLPGLLSIMFLDAAGRSA